MKKYILLFLLLAVGLSSEVYGQQVREVKSYQRTSKKFTPPGFLDWDPLLPRRDTVIMRGEEIEVGGYLSEEETKQFEIIGYGKAKKSDYKKSSYRIKLKPKQTTTYEFKWIERDGIKKRSGRIVYVAKTAEEKQQLEEKIQKSIKGGYSPFTTYQYTPPGHRPVKITNFSSSKAN